jgi:hypothetical protein
MSTFVCFWVFGGLFFLSRCSHASFYHLRLGTSIESFLATAIDPPAPDAVTAAIEGLMDMGALKYVKTIEREGESKGYIYIYIYDAMMRILYKNVVLYYRVKRC